MSSESPSSLTLLQNDFRNIAPLLSAEESSLMGRAPYNRAARNRLVESHLASAIGLGIRRSKGKLYPEEKKDLAQDIALAVTEAATRADSNYLSFGALAKATARGLSRNYPKRDKTVRARKREISLFTTVETDTETPLGDTLIDPLGEAPFDAINEAQPKLPQLMRQAMQSLSTTQRRIIQLTFGFGVSEHTQEEIAQALEIPIRTVRREFTAAMTKLRGKEIRTMLAKPLGISPEITTRTTNDLTQIQDTVLRMLGHFGGQRQPIDAIRHELGNVSKTYVYQVRDAALKKLALASPS